MMCVVCVCVRVDYRVEIQGIFFFLNFAYKLCLKTYSKCIGVATSFDKLVVDDWAEGAPSYTAHILYYYILHVFAQLHTYQRPNTKNIHAY